MKTKETSEQSIKLHKDTFGGRMLKRVIKLMDNKRDNAFEIMTILKGLGFDIVRMTNVRFLQSVEGTDGIIIIFLNKNEEQPITPNKQFTKFDSEKFQAYINKFNDNDKLFSMLETLDTLDIDVFATQANKFDVEYKLHYDDKDYVIFHKRGSTGFMGERLVVSNMLTTSEPIYKDWFMTITYHA